MALQLLIPNDAVAGFTNSIKNIDREDGCKNDGGINNKLKFRTLPS